MSRSLIAALLGATLATAFVTTPSRAGPLDHPAVGRYVAGWQERDGAKVVGALASGGRYRDPSLAAAIDGASLASHVSVHREARFELLEARQPAPDRVELRWRALWPGKPGQTGSPGQQAIEYVDTLRLDGNTISAVDSDAAAPPEATQLVADYEVLHDQPTPERLQALFTRDVEIHGSTLPPAGLRYDSYIPFLNTLRGTTFRRVPEVPLAQTKDGRIVMRWTLSAGPQRLAAGVDYITLDGGRIRKVVGVY